MRKRGIIGLTFDFILTFCTGGLWLVWILIRYLRNESIKNDFKKKGLNNIFKRVQRLVEERI